MLSGNLILLCSRPAAMFGLPSACFLECCFPSVRAPQWKSSIFIKRLFVGAIAVITESLDGNRVFIARLLNTNSHVLAHPVPYFDKNIGRLASLNYDIVPTQFCFWSSIQGSLTSLGCGQAVPKWFLFIFHCICVRFLSVGDRRFFHALTATDRLSASVKA